MKKNIKIILISAVVLIFVVLVVSVLLTMEMQRSMEYYQRQEEIPSSGEEIKSCLEGSWAWQGAFFNDDTEKVPNDPKNFMITFYKEGRMSSTTDCNQIMGGYEVEGSQIKIGEIGSTEMFCEGEILQDEYIELLQEVSSFFIDNQGRLILELPYDTGSMIFQPAN